MCLKACVSLLLWTASVDAARIVRNAATKSNETEDLSVGARASVSNLYTFGCPMVSMGRLRNPQTASGDGCFPGVRVVTKKEDGLIDKIDAVPGLLGVLDFEHVNMRTMFLNDQGKIVEKPCTWSGPNIGTPSTSLHMQDVYEERAKKIDYLWPAAVLALANQHNLNEAEVARKVSANGWGLVASAVVGEEVSHFMQNPADNRCLVSFEGSDNTNDWLNNLQAKPVSFCGLAQEVHYGFTKAAMEIVATSEFDEKIRSKLQNCNGVDIEGHSLGGAIASLFTACANNRVSPLDVKAYSEWKHFTWNQGTPKRMPYL